MDFRKYVNHMPFSCADVSQCYEQMTHDERESLKQDYSEMREAENKRLSDLFKKDVFDGILKGVKNRERIWRKAVKETIGNDGVAGTPEQVYQKIKDIIGG